MEPSTYSCSPKEAITDLEKYRTKTKQKRLVDIDSCLSCKHFDKGSSMYPTKGDYMICTKSERVIPQENRDEVNIGSSVVDIPQWCPLTIIGSEINSDCLYNEARKQEEEIDTHKLICFSEKDSNADRFKAWYSTNYTDLQNSLIRLEIYNEERMEKVFSYLIDLIIIEGIDVLVDPRAKFMSAYSAIMYLNLASSSKVFRSV